MWYEKIFKYKLTKSKYTALPIYYDLIALSSNNSVHHHSMHKIKTKTPIPIYSSTYFFLCQIFSHLLYIIGREMLRGFSTDSLSL